MLSFRLFPSFSLSFEICASWACSGAFRGMLGTSVEGFVRKKFQEKGGTKNLSLSELVAIELEACNRSDLLSSLLEAPDPWNVNFSSLKTPDVNMSSMPFGGFECLDGLNRIE